MTINIFVFIINIFVFIDSTSLEKYSHSPAILNFYKSYNQEIL